MEANFIFRALGENVFRVVKLSIAIVCTGLVLLGVVYNVVALPFSSPTFDLASWVVIAGAASILFLLGRT
jgi:hypothetical protein